MIEAKLFSVWDGLVGSLALIATIVLALCVMVGAVKIGDIPRHLGVTVGVVVLLIMLPAIIASLWNSMTLGQHLGIIVICAAIMVLVSSSRRRQTSSRRR
jgi:Ca2+/Na+ antiporter